MTASAIKQTISDDMKAAMRAKEASRLSAIRLLLAAIKQREVDERKELDDKEIIGVVEKMIKQRRESISQYENAGREDLAQQERYEIEVLQTYLPAALGDAELEQLIKEAISSSGAASMQDMGKVMNELRPKVQGRADMGQVSQKVKSLLG